MDLIDDIKFDKDGLVPCIAQDHKDGQVLMLAYMNREALEITIKEGRVCYYSRSRNKLWRKGEESGNVQILKEIFTDCDNDAIIVKIEQVGGCACHTGFRSCFYKKNVGESWKTIGEKIQDPDKMYKK